MIKEENSFDAILSINLKYEDFRENAEKSLHSAKQKMNLPGFRPGKVPVSIAKNYFWENIVREEIEKKLAASIQDYFKSNDIEILKPVFPVSSDIELDLKNYTEHEFSYEIGIQEKINIDIAALPKNINYFDVRIEDHNLEEEIEKIRDAYGEHTHPEMIENNDDITVNLEFTELNQDKEIFDGGLKQKALKKLSEVPEALKTFLIGKKNDEVFDVNIDDVFATRQDLSDFLKIEKLTADDLNQNFRIQIFAIHLHQKAELNEVLFSRFSEGKAKTIDEFRQDVREMLENSYKRNSDNQLNDDIYKHLLEEVHLTLPEKYFNRLFDKEYEEKKNKFKEDELEKEKKNFSDKIKWAVITDHLAKSFSIEASEKEIVEEAYYYISSLYFQYGIRDIKPDKMTQQIREFLKNQDNASHMQERVITGKVLDKIKTESNFEHKEITLDEFKKIIH